MLNVKFSEFYKYQELEDFLFEAEKMYGQCVNLKNLTQTPEGRNVYLVEITDSETGMAEKKGAYYIQACVHAQEGASTTVALYIIKQLLERTEYRNLLKKIAFYIIPRVNPDGTEYAITKKASIRSRFGKVYGKNRLIPKDLNGDGYILTMRWEEPTGPMKEDDVDTRIMVRRQPGDKGPFYQVITEGIIEDFDGEQYSINNVGTVRNVINPKEIKEQRDIDFNRNWPINWRVDNPNALLYPFSEPEMRAVGNFLVKQPNIFAGIDLHCGCNGILWSAADSDSVMNQEDLECILNIGRVAERITGFPLIKESEYKDSWRQSVTPHGNSNNWVYSKMGISHYVIELGNGFNCAGISTKEYLNADTQTRESIFMRRILKHHDEKENRIFIPWEEYQHPQLGKVEIGGLMQGNGYYMYPFVMKEIAPKVTEFVINHSERHPELIISNVEITKVGTVSINNSSITSISTSASNKTEVIKYTDPLITKTELNKITNDRIYRIRASIANIGGFGTRVMEAGGSIDSNYPVIVKLIIPGEAEILSRTKVFEINKLGALGDSEKVEWFVKVPFEVNAIEKNIIEASHPRAGICMKEVTFD